MIAMNMHETIIDSFENRDFQAAFRTIDIEERNEYLQEYLSRMVNANDGDQFNDIKIITTVMAMLIWVHTSLQWQIGCTVLPIR